MPRLKRDDVKARETFVTNIFKKTPKLSVAKANEQVKAEFGSMMRAQRMYQLRDLATKVQAPVEGARKGGKAKRITEAKRGEGHDADVFPLMIKVESKDQALFLGTALTQLRGAGMTNLKIGHVTDRYAIVEVA